ncbi:HNH endonuclease [Robbsia sp. Bb-Pol-6]|uniref:Putative HNH nuclease YajD n=1 Tax=Robbsia betulipollinis TaxID=2981849 RepID=A0ABT3ZRF9_9BURK|nr:HNH endonuclease [Robbsia betulipollinis]MCY0389139.1 HNH endonuclease [Robbsia betulipollinis]
MPSRPLRPCKHRGCPTLVAGGATYCPAHAGEAVKWQPDARRGNRHARGYGNAWLRVRAAILRRDCGICQACRRAGRVSEATDVDHITPKAGGGTDDEDNLEALCRPCHRAKTARE